MYGAISTVPLRAGTNLPAGIGTQAGGKGSKQSQEIAQKGGRPANDFLKAVFKEIPVSAFDPLYSKENYNYLYDSAKNYAKLLKKEFDLPRRPREFEKLYETFRAILPKDNRLEIIREEDCLSFQVIDDREEGLLYLIPCEIIDGASGALREIYICFFRLLRRTQGLVSLLEENPCFDMLCMDLPERELTEEDSDWMHLLADYQDGEINKTLKLVEGAPEYSIHRLRSRILKYIPQDEKEKKILELMLEGLKLFSRKKPIAGFSFFPKEDEVYFDCNYIVPIERIIQIVYSTNDQIFESLFDWTCDEANQGGYEIFSGGDMVLTPQTKEPLKADKYVEEFLKWLNKFCYELND